MIHNILNCFKSYQGLFLIIYSYRLHVLTCIFDSSLLSRRGPAGGRTGSCGGAWGRRATALGMAQRCARLLPFFLLLLGYGEPLTHFTYLNIKSTIEWWKAGQQPFSSIVGVLKCIFKCLIYLSSINRKQPVKTLKMLSNTCNSNATSGKQGGGLLSSSAHTLFPYRRLCFVTQ